MQYQVLRQKRKWLLQFKYRSCDLIAAVTTRSCYIKRMKMGDTSKDDERYERFSPNSFPFITMTMTNKVTTHGERDGDAVLPERRRHRGKKRIMLYPHDPRRASKPVASNTISLSSIPRPRPTLPLLIQDDFP